MTAKPRYRLVPTHTWYTLEEAAEIARRTPKAMRQLRARGLGPPFRKTTGRLLVRADELEAWLNGD